MFYSRIRKGISPSSRHSKVSAALIPCFLAAILSKRPLTSLSVYPLPSLAYFFTAMNNYLTKWALKTINVNGNIDIDVILLQVGLDLKACSCLYPTIICSISFPHQKSFRLSDTFIRPSLSPVQADFLWPFYTIHFERFFHLGFSYRQ